jgi:PKD repeat protein
VYTLRLSASDSALAASDDVIITVIPVVQTNLKPAVNAGPDQTITLPASATLAGSATDDGLPTGSTLTKSWSTVSGPGSVTFGNAAAPNTTATFSTAGVYTLRLAASDSALSASDDVIITVNSAPPVNQAPFVNAGPDFTIALPNGITLAGSATDDGLPTGSTLTKSWSKVSGPGTVTFGNAATLNSTANFSAAGIYTLRLTASDSLLSASDDVVFTVNAAPATNLAPVVNAGPDQTTTFPASATLAGTATDDGLPSGTLTKSWTKSSGPGTVVFVNSNSVNASATFSVPGNYTLRLTTSDGAITSFDDMNVVVNSCGTGVSGTKTIVATVTDSVGVTSVQMKLDGANMGSNITSAPYSILWNTTTTSNGCHVLSVVAQDAAGNQGTASVSTVVNN